MTLREARLRNSVATKANPAETFAAQTKRTATPTPLRTRLSQITVIRFFRELESFEVLQRRVFPAFLKHREPRTPIRIWVPGCSSGEEAYSIAMSLVEFLGNQAADFPIQIFGTDISGPAIAKARAGVYLSNIALDVTPESLLEKVLPQKTAVKDFTMEHDFPAIGHRKMLLNARQLDANDVGKTLILLAIQDLTRPAKRSEQG